MIASLWFPALLGQRLSLLFLVVFLHLLRTLRENGADHGISAAGVLAFSFSPRSPSVPTPPVSKHSSICRLPSVSRTLSPFPSVFAAAASSSSSPSLFLTSCPSLRGCLASEPQEGNRPARQSPFQAGTFEGTCRKTRGAREPLTGTRSHCSAGAPRPPSYLSSFPSVLLSSPCGRLSYWMKYSAEVASAAAQPSRQDSGRPRRRVFSINSKTFSGYSSTASSFLVPNLPFSLCSSSFSSSSLSSSSLSWPPPASVASLSPSPAALSPSLSGASSRSTRLRAEGEVATAAGREAPYPSFLVPSPHPPPPVGAERWEAMRDGEDKASEEERIRRKAQAWRVDRSVLELSPEELDQKIRDEKEEIHQRWRTRLDVEQRRHQDYFEQQREDQRELLKSLPAPPWVYLFRPVQLDESPPLKYDFRVYQPYFQSLIEASRPFIHTKIVPPSAIQRFLERRHSLDSSLSSGFRFKQIQPLFAHNSGCSAFFYFHTCFSSLAPAFLNALRRTSLSRIESLAVAAVKIEGAKHEFYSLPGIREDIVDDIFNNLGKIVFREKKVVYVHRKDIRAWLANRQRDKERMGDGMAGEKAEKEERPEAKEETAVRLPVRTGADEATETADKGGQTTEKERGDMPAGLEKESKTSQAEAGGVWNLLPPGTTLVRTRPRENAEKGWASWLQPSALSSGEDTEDDMYYRIPLPLPPANFTHPLRAKLRVRGPLVAVAGHIQLPEGVEVVNKNQYLFTVNSGYYVNMDFKIERIREYVMPEFGYDSLERDRDEEGFMYFTNHVAPVPIFAYAAERRGEAVHTKWDEVNENAPPGEEVEPEEDEEEAAVMTQVEDMLRQATAGAPDVVKASLSPLVQGREAAEKEEGTGEAVERERQEGNEGSGGQDREQQGERAQALIVEESRDKGDGAEENEKGAVAQDRRPSSSLSFDSMKPEDRYNAYRLLEPSEEMRAAYRRDYLENDLPYQNLGEVVTLEVQTDGSLTPREALLHCCDDLIKQVLDIQHALYHNCHVGVDGTEEEEFDDPDWYQDAHRYVGVPWNPYKGSAARSQKRQDFFFKTDVLRQYNILREKMDARREAFAEASSGEEGETQATKPRIWPVPGRGIRSDVFVATSPAEEEMMKGDILREKEEAVYRELEFQRNRLQDTPEGVGPRSGPTYGLSEHDLAERLLDEEEEEERIVNTSAIIRKEREEAWKDKQRTYRDLAENEPLKQLGDGKGLVKYPPDTKPMMEAPEWVMEDPMGQRKPIGFSEFNDD